MLNVLKLFSDQTNHSLFLHCFLIYLTQGLAVSAIKVIDFSSVIHSSSIFLWGFRVLGIKYPSSYFFVLILLVFYLCASFFLYRSSLMLKLVIRCD